MNRTCLSFLLCLLVPAAALADSPKSGIEIKLSDKSVDFVNGKELIARYHVGPEVAKPYFFPVLGPGGLKVTRGVPPPAGETSDHPHQKSAWFCHGDVIPEGIELKQKVKGVKGVDFWSENVGRGWITCVKKSVGVDGVLSTRNEWTTADRVKIMDETRDIRVHQIEGGYLFVFSIDLHASVCPITFGDTKEGSFGVRVPDSMTEKKGKGLLTNAEGKTTMKEIWGQRSKWSDYSGPVENGEGQMQVAGIALFDHPSNGVRAAWHSRDYGLMAANPFGRASFPGTKDDLKLVTLSKGEHLKLRYGMYVHKGDVKEGKVAEVFAAFAKEK